MDNHTVKLQELCRLCCSKIKTSKHYKTPKPATMLNELIIKCFNFNPQLDDPSVHPTCICLNCHSKLMRQQKKKDCDKFEAHDFKPHDEHCAICSKKAGRPKSLDSATNVSSSNIDINAIVDKASRYGFRYLKSSSNNNMTFYSVVIDETFPYIDKKIDICLSDGMWDIFVVGKKVSKEITELSTLPRFIPNVTDDVIFQNLSLLNICSGNVFTDLIVEKCKSLNNFCNQQGDIVAKIESPQGSSTSSFSLIRHVDCHLLVRNSKKVCDKCKEYCATLRAMQHRKNSNANKLPNISTNNKYLTEEDKISKINTLKKENKRLTSQVKYWHDKVKLLIEKDGVKVDDDLDDLMNDVTSKNKNPFESNSPEYLLWEQQIKHSKCASKTGMRWHPLIIRWCISIYLKSPGTYKQIRSTNFLHLPCKNTLLKYVNFTEPKCGFNKDIIYELAKNINIKNLKDYERNVSIILDEMKIKSGLVFCKSSGKLVGFTDLGDINNKINDFKRQVFNENEENRSLAQYVLVYMVRGIFSNLCVPFGHFASEGFTGDELYYTTWEAVGILESLNFKVRAIIADGASPNRKFFKIHKNENTITNGQYHAAQNEFASDRKIYFICDVPHLIKTVRNNLENSNWNLKTRNLMLHGQLMGWHQIVKLYEWDTMGTSDALGLRLGHKLREEHINLNPNTRMRVNLAAQVLSKTVENMLILQNDPSTTSLREFISMFDEFFDCLNVSRKINTTLKPALNPYRSCDDIRFQWLKEKFLGFLDNWNEEVQVNGDDLEQDEKNRMLLSYQTAEGLHITVFSFTTLAQELLEEYPDPERYILSEKFSQDPLEEYFSKQRQRGGANESPSLEDVNRNFVALTVAGNDLVKIFNGNTRGRYRENTTIDINNMELPPAKKKKDKL